jgi:A/G-specific adenine glycosylase
LDFALTYHTYRASRQSESHESRLNPAAKLLAWYDRSHRAMPWRVPPGALAAGVRPDPYGVWLSEIMLQQTTVAAVKSYFLKFIQLWPTVSDLAAAGEDDVLKAWAGLGYYSRARNLKKCADEIVRDHNGAFPDTAEALSNLPGIGPYTSAAIASIAFDERVPVVDGNVERVFTRLFAIKTPIPAAKPEIRQRVADLMPPARPGDYAQALMDLGATLCSPRKPSCLLCPLNADCQAFKSGNPEAFPVKLPKSAKPLRRGAAFVAFNAANEVLLTKRGPKGLLASMSQVPTSDWSSRTNGISTRDAAPFAADWKPRGSIRHVFTHFELELSVFSASTAIPAPSGHWWSADIASEALPSLMKKVIAAAL